QTAALYDFLYRDSNRIASYYAQLFSGRLSSIEETDATRESQDKDIKGDAKIVSGGLKWVKEATTGAKRVFDPHDMVATDVLAELGKRHVSTNVREAQHGGLVRAKGTVVFLDRVIVDLAEVVISSMLADEEAKQKRDRNPRLIQQYKLIRAMLPKLAFPSAFLFHAADGSKIAGTIKEAGMEEPISGYYFKFGASGISDVHLVGVKESPSQTVQIPKTQLFGAGQQAVQGVSGMLFSSDCFRVNPVAMFRL